VVSAFQASFPNVRVQIRITERIVHHIAEDVDIAFKVGTSTDPSLVARTLLTLRALTIFEVLVFTLFEAEFPFRFPRAVGENGKRKWELEGAGAIGTPTSAGSSAGREPVAFGTTHDLTRVGQRGEPLVQSPVANAAQRTQLPDGKRAIRFGDSGGDSLVDGGRWRGWRRDRRCDFESQRVTALCEREADCRWRRRSAMFDGEVKLAARTTKVQVRVTPGMELGRAAQRLTCAHAARGFASVMHDEHGELMLSLQGTKVREQRCHFAAGVLVDAVQTNERIEDQKARLELCDGVFEAFAVGSLIDA
jgi:hypothetical protein